MGCAIFAPGKGVCGKIDDGSSCFYDNCRMIVRGVNCNVGAVALRAGSSEAIDAGFGVIIDSPQSTIAKIVVRVTPNSCERMDVKKLACSEV